MSNLMVEPSQCESSDKLNNLNAEVTRLTEKNAKLVKQVNELNSKVRFAEQGRDHALEQYKALGEPQKAGPFGTLGYSVLLSDVDIVYLQNPFHYLYRDSDVEFMTDGHNNRTAYGYNDVFDEPVMGWARYAHTMWIWVFNSGFFYIRPTLPAIELLDRVADRLAHEKAWDQAVFNEELYFPSHPGYLGLHAAKRTLDFYLFMNNKLPRMKAVVVYYVDGKQDALDPFPVGSH
ncbi:hypothetical protein Leryth_005324 [Lithospermum erythrorhizon]|nr:hypothetical protein Leryth_005324 [Lithospermum erythrorhizon]